MQNSSVNSLLSDSALDALRSLLASAKESNVVAVETRIDSARFLAFLAIDEAELDRRNRAGITAVTSTGDLHALWSVPHGRSVTGTLSEMDERSFRAMPAGLISMHEGGVVDRSYRPIGHVEALAVVGSDQRNAISGAQRIPPIFKRACVVTETMVTKKNRCRAERSGVGILQVDSSNAEWLTPIREAVMGVPAVYRWWVAELVFDSWLSQAQTAQPTN